MLKALDDLERAVSRLEERARGKAPGGSVSRHGESTDEKHYSIPAGPGSERVREEAAELIRRAIRRLRSL